MSIRSSNTIDQLSALRDSQVFNLPTDFKTVQHNKHREPPVSLVQDEATEDQVRYFLYEVLTVKGHGIAKQWPQWVLETCASWKGTGATLRAFEKSDFDQICPMSAGYATFKAKQSKIHQTAPPECRRAIGDAIYLVVKRLKNEETCDRKLREEWQGTQVGGRVWTNMNNALSPRYPTSCGLQDPNPPVPRPASRSSRVFKPPSQNESGTSQSWVGDELVNVNAKIASSNSEQSSVASLPSSAYPVPADRSTGTFTSTVGMNSRSSGTSYSTGRSTPPSATPLQRPQTSTSVGSPSWLAKQVLYTDIMRKRSIAHSLRPQNVHVPTRHRSTDSLGPRSIASEARPGSLFSTSNTNHASQVSSTPGTCSTPTPSILFQLGNLSNNSHMSLHSINSMDFSVNHDISPSSPCSLRHQPSVASIRPSSSNYSLYSRETENTLAYPPPPPQHRIIQHAPPFDQRRHASNHQRGSEIYSQDTLYRSELANGATSAARLPPRQPLYTTRATTAEPYRPLSQNTVQQHCDPYSNSTRLQCPRKWFDSSTDVQRMIFNDPFADQDISAHVEGAGPKRGVFLNDRRERIVNNEARNRGSQIQTPTDVYPSTRDEPAMYSEGQFMPPQRQQPQQAVGRDTSTRWPSLSRCISRVSLLHYPQSDIAPPRSTAAKQKNPSVSSLISRPTTPSRSINCSIFEATPIDTNIERPKSSASSSKLNLVKRIPSVPSFAGPHRTTKQHVADQFTLERAKYQAQYSEFHSKARANAAAEERARFTGMIPSRLAGEGMDPAGPTVRLVDAYGNTHSTLVEQIADRELMKGQGRKEYSNPLETNHRYSRGAG